MRVVGCYMRLYCVFRGIIVYYLKVGVREMIFHECE